MWGLDFRLDPGGEYLEESVSIQAWGLPDEAGTIVLQWAPRPGPVPRTGRVELEQVRSRNGDNTPQGWGYLAQVGPYTGVDTCSRCGKIVVHCNAWEVAYGMLRTWD